MTNDIAIRVNNLSKCYHIYEKPHKRLLQGFLGSKKQHYKEFWALKDISFEIKKGETVGIIGRNGAGKSTLLQIICGTLTPTSGSIETYGRVAALLELGSGFNPEFTGRENVYMNAAVLGLTNEEIDARYDDIVAFADIGDFIEQPVKTYSSGMMVRLAFAVQITVEPEILIIDEALSVGDFFFQQKCFGRLRQMQAKGITIIFVSHDTGTVRNLCSTSIYLRRGELFYIGDTINTINKYLNETDYIASDNNLLSAKYNQISPEYIKTDLNAVKKISIWKKDTIDINTILLAVTLMNTSKQSITQARISEKIIIHIYFKSLINEAGHISLAIKNRYDQIVTCIGSYTLGMPPCDSGSETYAIFELQVDLTIEAGLYSLKVVYGNPTGANQGVELDQTDWFGPLQVNWDYDTKTAPFLGMCGLPTIATILR